MTAGPSLRNASLILIAGFLGSRVLGVVRNMALAGTFGAGPELDAYFAAFRLPDLIFQLIGGAALGSAFLPTFANHYAQQSPGSAWRLASASINLFTLAGAVAAAVCFIAAPAIVPLTVPGYADASQEETVHLTRIMLGSSVFFCASGLVTGVLNGRRHFFLPAFAPWVYNLSIIAGALLLQGPAGVAGPAWGVTIGAGLHLLVQLPGLRRIGMKYQPSAGFGTPGFGEVLRLMGPRILGLGSIQVNWLVTTVLASGLAAGSLAGLSYGWAVAMLPIGVIAIAPAMAAFPQLAEAAALQKWDRYRHLLSSGLRQVLLLSFPAGAGLALLGFPLVALLFQRGEFDAASTRMTAEVLACLSLGLPAHAVLEVVARGAYAMKDTKTPMLFAGLGMGVHACASLLLVGSLEANGLALAMSLSAWVEAAGLTLVVTRRAPGFARRELARPIIQTGTATMFMSAVVWAWLAVAPSSGGPVDWLVTTLAGAISGGLAFAAAGALIGIPEVRSVLRMKRSD
ncbi:MAG: murein biosynthesis integral membrane protein MurJ [Dehalococcoidia bacterium]|nr:murein biosynthesis integral membrane protein MurJ [Dehalococcoidia bacterium]